MPFKSHTSHNVTIKRYQNPEFREAVSQLFKDPPIALPDFFKIKKASLRTSTGSIEMKAEVEGSILTYSAVLEKVATRIQGVDIHFKDGSTEFVETKEVQVTAMDEAGFSFTIDF